MKEVKKLYQGSGGTWAKECLEAGSKKERKKDLQRPLSEDLTKRVLSEKKKSLDN